MGGYTADNAEVWKGTAGYIKSVVSPDQIAEQSKALWYRVVLPSGLLGFIRSDLVQDTGNRTPSGLPIFTPVSNATNVRSAPSTNDAYGPAIGKANIGDKLVFVEQRREWNAYSWVTAPMTAVQLQTQLNSKLTTKYTTPINTLEISKKGPSGRAVEVKANGIVIPVSYPDAYRSMLGGLWSTLFEVDNTGSYTVLGANGATVTYPNGNKALYGLNASATTPGIIDQAFFGMGVMNTPRYMTISPTFRFIGNGYGHGLGMSQWGAKDLADFMGYTYKQILGYYFQAITIEKGSSM
jgi:stage II sporulation protein D